MSYYIVNNEKHAYVAIDKNSCMSLTTSRDRAKRFTEKAAQNYINHSLSMDGHKYGIIWEGDAPEDSMKAICVVRYKIPSLKDNQWIKKAKDELRDQIQQCDLEMSDIYHFAYLHPRLPADKGYKLYQKLRDVVALRAEAKIQLNALCTLDDTAKPYRPRTFLYKELEENL